jgi:hypothetical protein
MRMTRIARGLAAICALVVAGVVITASTASASITTTSLLLGGSISQETDFQAYIVTRLYETGTPGQSQAYSYTQLELGKAGTISATDCQLETWLTLVQGDPLVDTTWDSPHWTYHCMDFIGQQGFFVTEGHTPQFNTVASSIVTKVKVRLYYNHSSSPGYTYFFMGQWTQTS